MTHLKTALAVGIGVTLLGCACYQTTFRVSNEIGPIGSDKAGRQILIQSWQARFAEQQLAVTVGSEWDDTSLLYRLVVQEPMRTTFRITLTTGQQFDTDGFLATPLTEVVGIDGEFHLRDDWTLSGADILRKVTALRGSTVGHLLAAYGFKRFEIMKDGGLATTKDLPTLGNGNTKWSGSSN